MNRVLIYGGLGNQMFQYALNIALNEKGKKSEIMFTEFFYDPHHNGFNLGKAFSLKLPFPQKVYNYLLLNGGFFIKNRICVYLFKRLIPRYKKMKFEHSTFYEKKEFVYDVDVFKEQTALLVGTWQAEAYFRGIEQKIRSEFIFRTPEDIVNRKVIDEILNCNSVSIHIRRGDYFKAEWAQTHAVIKDAVYYNHAIGYLNERVSDARFFIFSDDIIWAKENLKLSNCRFIDYNTGANSYIDMYLMSLCRHNIIANSTFSWWGAWLNNTPNKIVIAPERWLNSINCEAIYPSEWVKMKV